MLKVPEHGVLPRRIYVDHWDLVGDIIAMNDESINMPNMFNALVVLQREIHKQLKRMGSLIRYDSYTGLKA